MRVALESTVITHGLPYPQNVETAFALEAIVKSYGCVPYTIAILNGQVKIGMTEDEVHQLAEEEYVYKAGVRELPIVIAKKACASTTVSATARLAALEGISVFATGGIGGVHFDPRDVSQDLYEMARTSIVIVSAGPKAILDLPGTNEMLESLGVTVVGYKTDEMPAFYSRRSGIKVPMANSPEEIAQMLLVARQMGLTNTILAFNPIQSEYELSPKEVEGWRDMANHDLEKAGVHGKEVTPFLLARMAVHSNGRTVESNRRLLENNVRLASEISLAVEELRSGV